MTAWQAARDGAFAHALSGIVVQVMRASTNKWRAIARLALAVGAIFFASLGAAQALTATSTVVVASQNASTLGQSVTFTATVSGSGGTPTGTVTFTDTNTSQTLGTITLSGGVASVTTSTLALGNHTIVGNYNGNATFAASSGSTFDSVTKDASTTGLAASPNPSTLGQSVTFTATVSGTGGTPTGTVTFKDNTTNQTLGTITLSGGVATVSTSALTIGNHVIFASYGGDGTFDVSSNSLLQEVDGKSSNTAVVASPNPSTVGQSVTFTATVSGTGGTPTGTVTFTDLNTSQTLGTITLSGGVAAVSTSTLAVGNHLILASYNGDSTFSASSNSVLQQVTGKSSNTAVVAAPNPSNVGQSVTFTATVSGSGGTPTGTVTFTDLNTSQTLGTITLSGGVAAISTSTLTAGNHLILASYNGDATFGASSNSVLQQVVGGKVGSNTALVASPNPSSFGQSVTFTATVSGSGGTPTGTVTFTDTTTSQTLGTITLSGGVATVSTSALAIGNHTILASYNGDSNFNSSSNSVVQQVTKAASNTAVVASPNPSTVGQSVTFTATVSGSGGTPTGTVTFTDNTTSQTLGTITLSGGVATVSTSALTIGNHVILASYGGDSTFTSSSNSVLQQVGGKSSNTAVVASPNPSTLGQSVTFTATVSGSGGTPTGTVTFTDLNTSQTLGTITLSGGVASVSTSTLTIGNHLVLASYNGDSNFNASSNSVLQQVGKVGTTTTVTASPNPSTPGQSVTFTATVSGSGGTPTGTVTFTDTTTSQTLGTITLSGGVATVSTSTLATGNHVVLASYSGDTTFNSSSGSVLQVVNGTASTTAVAGSPNPSTFGQSVTFTATVSGSGGTPTGTVTFTDTTTSQTLGTSTLSGGVASVSTSALTGGNHTIQAAYSGDSSFAASTGSVLQTVNKVGSTTTLTSSANPSVFGQAVTFTATVSGGGSGTPTGTVTFLDAGSPIGNATLSGGVATFTISTLAAGSHTITTSYAGDGNFNGSTGSLTGNPQVVNKADTTTTVTSSVNPSAFGQPITFTATISGAGSGTPTGTVTFLDGGSAIGNATLSGGVATFTISTLAVGNHTITTSYGGDGNFNGSTGSLTGNPQVVNKANTTTTVTSSANPSVFGQPVTFTANISAVGPGAGAPTGTVTFLDGGSPIGNATLAGGVATFSISTLAVGNHTITTSYAGDGSFNGSTGSLTGNPQVVNKANTATTVTSSLNPSAFGQTVTFTANISAVGPGAGAPTGMVTFLDGGNPIGNGTLSGGSATFQISTLAVGNHTITTSYGGDSSFNGSTGSLTGNPQVVNKANSTATVTSSANPSVSGQPVTFTATISGGGSGTATGTVTFLDGGSPIGNGTLSGGIATFTISTLAVGNHTITISYPGDGNFGAATGSLTGNPQVINKADTSTSVTSSPNPSTLGQPVTFTATVSPVGPGTGTPSGTVNFLDGGSPIGNATLSGGVATFTISTLAVGNHTITTSYSGDGNFNGSTGTLTGNPQVVGKGATATTVNSSANPSNFGQPVTFTATVSPVTAGTGTPTGSVTFLDGGNSIGSATLSGGAATFTTSALAVGNHTITATYNGDSNFGGSTGSLSGNPQVVNKGSTTVGLTSSQNPSTFGQGVTFTATIAPNGSAPTAPTGTVTFLDGGNPIGSGTLSSSGGNGVATFTISTLSVGSHSITASFPGDANFAPASGTLTGGPQVVGKGTTTTALTASPNPSTPGQAVTFTATVKQGAGSTVPTGTVTFKDGGTTIGTGTLSGGVATFTTSTLTTGSHSITAVYGGDTNFGASTSPVLTQNVNNNSDSTKLREMQIATMPVVAAAWGAATSSAMDDAVSAGFGGNPQSLSPAGTGFTYYFNDDAPVQHSGDSDQESLRRYLSSPTGSLASPDGSAKSTAGAASAKRVDDDFRALGYAGGMPTKAPPPSSSTPHDWLAWVTVRGTDYWRGTVGNDLKGDQVDLLAGLTRRVSKDLVVGVLGGYEHFDYTSQAFTARLKGDGWTAGAYLGWKLAPNLRFDAGGAWSGIAANDVAGTAAGNFTGTRWLINGGLTGTYPWQMLVLEPSVRVFALWEHERAFTDSLGTFQSARNFETGRASTGVKAIYPFAWTSSVVALSPYAGLYADYYFSRDDAQTAGLTTVPLLQGFSARVTGGVAASFAGGVTLGAGGEFGGIGSATHIWTWTARGRIPF